MSAITEAAPVVATTYPYFTEEHDMFRVVEAVLVKQGDVVAPGDSLIEIKAVTTDGHR